MFARLLILFYAIVSDAVFQFHISSRCRAASSPTRTRLALLVAPLADRGNVSNAPVSPIGASSARAVAELPHLPQ